MPVTVPLPPRLIIDVLCVRSRDGYCAAHSFALEGVVAGGTTADGAALKLRRLAEDIAGEPVRALVTVLHEDELVRG